MARGREQQRAQQQRRAAAFEEKPDWDSSFGSEQPEWDSGFADDSIAAYGGSSQLGGGMVVSSIGGPLAPPSRTPRQDPDMAALQSGWGRTFFDQSGQAPSQQQRVQRARQAVYGCRPGEETYDCLELAPP